MRSISLFLLFTAICFNSHAVRLPAVINSNMVLQRDMQIPIWGWGEAGEKISVHFAGQKKQLPTRMRMDGQTRQIESHHPISSYR